MTRPVTSFISCCVLAVWMLPGSASGQPQIVFSANYDINLVIDGDRGSNQASAQVRDGHTIPVEYAWNDAGIALDLALVASVSRSQ